MAISMHQLFKRQRIKNEVISLRNSLENHPSNAGMSLRQADHQLRKLAEDNGYLRGCQRPGAITVRLEFLLWTITEKKLGGALPNWVPVAGETQLVRTDTGDVKFVSDYLGETRTVEGILKNSKISDTDFPFASWHKYYDWNLDVLPDQQYRYLLNHSNFPEDQEDDGVIECEWDSAYFPQWAWPHTGNRVWIVGRWIYDCGHPDEKDRHKTEIHPPKAIASFRSEAIKFRENNSPVQANVSVLFIGRDGGYWRQPINNQDYAFDLYLPPKPYAEANPIWTVESKTGNLPVQPRIEPFPSNEPKALRVTIPLKGVTPHPENYGAIIAGGWSDPRNSEGSKIKRFRITVTKILFRETDDGIGDPDFYIYVGINGRWRVWESLSGDTNLNFSVELDLHLNDQIHISVCGFEADEINRLMGKDIGTTWASISDHEQNEANARKITSGFLSLGSSADSGLENDSIGKISQSHPPRRLEMVTIASSTQDYKLQYKIDEI